MVGAHRRMANGARALMSGRSGYRKTDRKQAKYTNEDRIQRALNGGVPIAGEVRLVFFLPGSLAGFVPKGQHGIGVEVLASGLVRITGKDSENCFYIARGFFGTVAKDRPGFTVTGTLIRYGDKRLPVDRHMTVVRGCLVVSAGAPAPKLFEAV